MDHDALMPQADRHKHPPIRFRPTEGNRERIAAYAAETGLAVNAILNKALDTFWQASGRGATAVPTGGEAQAQVVGPLSIGGIEIPVVADDRQPPGIVSVIAPGEEKTEVRSFALAPEEPASSPEPFRKRTAKHPCEHRVQPGSYCGRCQRLV